MDDDIFDREWKRQLRLMRRFMKGMGSIINNKINVDYEEPLMDLIDKGDRYLIEMDLPGVDKKDIDISIVNNKLKVHAKRKNEKKEEKEGYIRSERIFSAYQRLITLPEDADENSIKARYEDGVLKIEINKKPGTPGKKVNIE
ncbi:heat shock protein [Nanobdella aerobiophila]|uniref:Heat shock protein n=1 Tax=Nanobdella aerobiophila TaxID=2586965 RepID=A0A915ST52_9ARCH|nr:Hsp20/alpha crystallin family protein [Nanobdella aerobiophila]BBL45906.1 heat shock protein [Nanobdella aerobiophila]